VTGIAGSESVFLILHHRGYDGYSLGFPTMMNAASIVKFDPIEFDEYFLARRLGECEKLSGNRWVFEFVEDPLKTRLRKRRLHNCDRKHVLIPVTISQIKHRLRARNKPSIPCG